MTKRAAIKQADLRRMAAIAKQEGVKIEAVIDGAIYRVSPDIPAANSNEAIGKKATVRL